MSFMIAKFSISVVYAAQGFLTWGRAGVGFSVSQISLWSEFQSSSSTSYNPSGRIRKTGCSHFLTLKYL